MGIVEAFKRAKNSVIHAHELNTLGREARHTLDGQKWHSRQAESFRRSKNPWIRLLHISLGLLKMAERHKSLYTAEALRSGKSFWETHDIEPYARAAAAAQSSEAFVDVLTMIAALPDNAVRSLMEYVQEMKQHENAAGEKKTADIEEADNRELRFERWLRSIPRSDLGPAV
jgi:hypothetical protein